MKSIRFLFYCFLFLISIFRGICCDFLLFILGFIFLVLNNMFVLLYFYIIIKILCIFYYGRKKLVMLYYFFFYYFSIVIFSKLYNLVKVIKFFDNVD